MTRLMAVPGRTASRRTARAWLARAVMVLVASPGPIAAQTASPRPTTIELDNLRTPTSPAFTILGVSPTSIARPSTPRALALDLVSNTRGGSVIPVNYALEVAPYWLRARPALAFEQYTRPTVLQSIRQTFAISLATSGDDGGSEPTSDATATRVAIGARVTPIAGRPSSRFDALLDALDREQRARIDVIVRQADLLDAIDEAEAARLTTAAALVAAEAAGDGARTAEFRAAAAALTARARTAREAAAAAEQELAVQADSMRSLALAMGAAEAERVGLFAEAATAVAFAFPSDDFDAGGTSRFGAWATVGYRLEDPRLDIIGVARAQRDVRAVDRNLIDLGARLVWRRDRLALSGEVVHRTVSTVADGALGEPPVEDLALRSGGRAVGTIDVRATDAVYLSASFGRDHQVGGRRPLVASIGLDLQLGKKPRVLLPPGR